MTIFSHTGDTHNLSMGLVGLPNIGKSTIFNALTDNNVPAMNYPFCTISPHHGICFVPDERIDYLSEIYKPHKTTYSTLLLTDIAGLIKGSATGAGLGNAFLDNIRRVDGIFHVIKLFKQEGEDLEDPNIGIATIRDELRLKDLEILNRKTRDRSPLLQKLKDTLEQKWINEVEWTGDEVKLIGPMDLLTTKPIVYLINVGDAEYDWLIQKGYIKCDEEVPATTHATPNKEILKYLKQLMPSNPVIYCGSRVNKKMIAQRGYEALGLINFFTSGKDEVRSWTIRKDTFINKAGSVIHNDFSEYFIMADVIEYEDLKKEGSEAAVRNLGKVYQRGKGYIVKDGDIILFKANPAKKKTVKK